MLVQFGDNWSQKIPLTTKLDLACSLIQFWLSLEFFVIQLFPNWTTCSPITYTYYTLYSLSVFSLAKSLQLIVEISTTYRLVSYLLADNWLMCRLCAQCTISNNNNYQFRFFATLCLSLFSSKQCLIKQLLHLVFVIS